MEHKIQRLRSNENSGDYDSSKLSTKDILITNGLQTELSAKEEEIRD